MNKLIQFDQELFFHINRGMQNPFFDWLMPLVRNAWLWSPMYLFLIAFFIINYKKQGWIMIGLLLIVFTISDYTSSSIIKPFFERLRPCNDPVMKDYVNQLVSCGSGFSFTSSHAANHFAIAFCLIQLFYKKWKWILPIGILWATSIAFAQVYVGLHFPLDVLGGGLLGVIVGNVTGSIAKTRMALA